MQPKRHFSPNFNDRAVGAQIEWIIVHYTDMLSFADSLAILTCPESQVSAHYVIDEDGTIYSLVEEEKRAWHAGQSHWRGVSDLNSYTIGIELQNPGHSHGYRPFPEAQMAALLDLCKDIQGRRGLTSDCLWGHSDIAPHRKQDPGHLFPWKRFAEKGLGIWLDATASGALDLSWKETLQHIGYDPAYPQESLIAFQRHFRPENFTGHFDEETEILMHSVLQQCRR